MRACQLHISVIDYFLTRTARGKPKASPDRVFETFHS